MVLRKSWQLRCAELVWRERGVEQLRCRYDTPIFERRRKAMLTILVVILVLMMVGALPSWPHSRNWGYYPSGGLGLILLIVIILLLAGY
jgi:hypothetical protein